MKRNLFQKLGDFVLGKGFYIVLFLCVAAIGISGYYLIRTVTGGSQPSEPVTANPTVTLPDSSAQEAPSTQPLEEETPEEEPPAPAVQEDDPQPVKEPAQEEVSTQPEYKEVVYTWPVKGQVLRAFTAEALAYDPTMGDWRTHSGIDIAAAEGIQVLATAKGTVLAVTEDDMLGVCVAIGHGDGLVSVYANLDPEVQVVEGDSVYTGDIIGQVGNTAIAESALPSHLHFAMVKHDLPADPMGYLPDLA